MDDDYEKGGSNATAAAATSASSQPLLMASGGGGGGTGEAGGEVSPPWLAVGTVSIAGESADEVAAAGGGSSATVVQFSAAEHKVQEAAGVVRVSVQRSGGGMSTPLRVRYWTEGGSATPGDDYVSLGGGGNEPDRLATLDFSPHQAVGYIDVPIMVDDEGEVEEEYFMVHLSLREADNTDNTTLAKLG